VTPAIGWPAFCLLLLLYFVMSFMLLGAVFLGVGGQANSIREIQTLSLPITLGQVVIFLLAGATVGKEGGLLTWTAAIFPLSSPLTMIGMAAQSGKLWIHLPALLWQAFWVFLIVRISVRLFRRNVMKSGSPKPFFSRLGARRA
jgi:ABC-2 type transport system permease protein